VSGVVNLATQIERDSPDTNVTGQARDARRLATTFKEAKRDAKITEAYGGFPAGAATPKPRHRDASDRPRVSIPRQSRGL
jgi:hypothetical protein